MSRPLSPAVATGLALACLLGLTGAAVAAEKPVPAHGPQCPDGYRLDADGRNCVTDGLTPYNMPSAIPYDPNRNNDNRYQFNPN
ncbi:hypothetical protein GCM10023321_64140 [Pseudonocardia eucalypti]|uniref:Uncharacterized protein n=1 Tax=Pseudonocardia eucalypti TaxID=648755 RepID=A0ABP9QXQ2_9PSEU|nr:hypothetical protein [Pseudonocardia eucalypti]